MEPSTGRLKAGECLDEHWFLTLDDARETIENWRLDYNRVRPHSPLGYLAPEGFRDRAGEFISLLNSTPSDVPPESSAERS